MKRVLIAVCALALAGCATDANMMNKLNPESQFQSVDCTALYQVKTFSNAGDYEVEIHMVRVNRVGEVYVKPVKSLARVNFQSPWVKSDVLSTYKCQSNGLLEHKLSNL